MSREVYQAISSQLFIYTYRKIKRGRRISTNRPTLMCLRATITPYGYSQKRISVIRVGIYTFDSNNWMPRMYVRGYVCAIIGFGRDRVTIVIKSYEAAAGWRSAVALTTCRPVISRSTSPRTTCIFVD